MWHMVESHMMFVVDVNRYSRACLLMRQLRLKAQLLYPGSTFQYLLLLVSLLKISYFLCVNSENSVSIGVIFVVLPYFFI